MWAVHHGRPPEGWLWAQCGSRLCSNPRHLIEIGSYGDGFKGYVARAIEEGRRPLGHAQKLTEQGVIEIRDAWWSGSMSQGELAERYGIAQPTVHEIVHRRTHRYIRPTAIEIEGRRHWVSPCRPYQVEPDEPEVQEAIDTGTGRIQRLLDGATWVTYQDIRRAELASGLDREVIALALLQGQGWRYEPGPAPVEADHMYPTLHDLTARDRWDR